MTRTPLTFADLQRDKPERFCVALPHTPDKIHLWCTAQWEHSTDDQIRFRVINGAWSGNLNADQTIEVDWMGNNGEAQVIYPYERSPCGQY